MAIYSTASLSKKKKHQSHFILTSKMMQMEFLPSWSTYNPIDSPLEVGFCFAEMDAQVSSFEFSTSSVSIEDFSVISSSTLLSSTLYGSETYTFPLSGNHLPGILPGEQCLSRVGKGDTLILLQMTSLCLMVLKTSLNG